MKPGLPTTHYSYNPFTGAHDSLDVELLLQLLGVDSLYPYFSDGVRIEKVKSCLKELRDARASLPPPPKPKAEVKEEVKEEVKDEVKVEVKEEEIDTLAGVDVRALVERFELSEETFMF